MEMELNFTHHAILWRLEKKPVAFGCMWHRIHINEYNELYQNGVIIVTEHENGNVYFELPPQEKEYEQS